MMSAKTAAVAENTATVAGAATETGVEAETGIAADATGIAVETEIVAPGPTGTGRRERLPAMRSRRLLQWLALHYYCGSGAKSRSATVFSNPRSVGSYHLAPRSASGRYSCPAANPSGSCGSYRYPSP